MISWNYRAQGIHWPWKCFCTCIFRGEKIQQLKLHQKGHLKIFSGAGHKVIFKIKSLEVFKNFEIQFWEFKCPAPALHEMNSHE
jgi:hypothetical protein